MTAVTSSSPLGLPPTRSNATFGPDPVTFDFFVLAPMPDHPDAFALLGEAKKFVPLSSYRFAAFAYDDDNLDATLAGAPNETVTLALLPPNATRATFLDCVLDADGSATLHCAASCHCA